MTRQIGKARYPAIALLAIASVVLFFRLQSIESARVSAAILLPTPEEVASALIRAGLDPQALAAGGLSIGAVQTVVGNVEAFLAAHPGSLQFADSARAEARQQNDQLTRVVQSGTATEDQVNTLPTARAELAQAEAQLTSLLNEIFDTGTASLPQGQRATLIALRANRNWGLPVEFLVVDRSEPQWVQLRDCLANERISQELDESPDPEAQAWLAQYRANPLVASAKANFDANLGSITAAWNQSAASPP
jgi:hypothetical protein